MNRWTLLFRPCLIAIILTLAIPQDTVASRCASLNDCHNYASQSQNYHQDERGEHPYRTCIAIIVITLITTKIAKSALKSWLIKP
ncbi:hypothetical protein NIES2100_75650 [Calothrix sp. NIES-2100]|uniref:hypothetical protein n=1 Tax=Calothrix sp. NIES-2100 TaxID=1954172 RepID=UPI000B608056|nr:hypothetical protein NIES2100_75650 [Calothrix sp. NIES-2100]